MTTLEPSIFSIILWYTCGIIGTIIIGNIARCLQFIFRVIVSIFIVLVFPLSLLWFISHAILQIPTEMYIYEEEYLLIEHTLIIVTLSCVMDTEMRKNRSRVPPLLGMTLAPNILLIYTAGLLIWNFYAGFIGEALIMLIIIMSMFFMYYALLFIKNKRYRFCICLPFSSIFMTIASILMWILFLMKLFNIFGFKIFGLNETKLIYWDKIFKNICGCNCNKFEREYNKYIKYQKWYIKERWNILSIYINDSNVINIIVDYLDSMDNNLSYISFDSRHTFGYKFMDPAKSDGDVIIDMFSLNRIYIKAWIEYIVFSS